MEGSVFFLPEEVFENPNFSLRELPEDATIMRKNFTRLWDAIFNRYGIIVDEEDLNHTYIGLHSYYEYKIKETYDENFRWNECYKNNFQLRVHAENFTCLHDLLTHMVKNRLVPQLKFNDKKERIIKLINKDEETNLKLIKTLWDVRKDLDILKLIFSIPFLLHGRKLVPLGALCGNCENVLKTIKLVDIIRRTSENDCYINVGKVWKKPPDDYIKRNFLLGGKQIPERNFSKTWWDLYVISGEAGTGKSTVLNYAVWLLDPKCLIIKCDLADCVDDFQTDGSEIIKNPVKYFFNKSREQGGWDTNSSILEAIYEKQAADGRLIIALDSFEQVLYEFAEYVVEVLDKIREAPMIRVLLTIDPRNEFLLRRQFPYSNIFQLKELNRKDIKNYLKVNNVTIGKGCEEMFLNNPLHLYMLKDIYSEDVRKIKDQFTKISDIYSEYIKHCMIAKGKNIVLLTHMALICIFPEKHVNVRVNFREEFPHRTIAEYLVAMWISDPINSNRAEAFLPTIFKSYKYNKVCKFLIEILRSDPQSSKTDQWGIPPLVWEIISCAHSCGKELKEALRNVEQMAITMGANAFKNDISNCPFVDLNGFQFENKDCFLHVASWYENENLVRILLEIGSNNLDSKNYLGRTPLHHSCLNGNSQITKYLLDYGANPNILDENGDAPLHIACREAKSPDVVKILLEHKAEPNLWNPNNSSTSLHVAVTSRENLQIVRNLLEHNADPNAFTSYARSVLYLACRKGSSDLIKLLIDLGADPNIQNEDKWNCLHEASNENNIEAAATLLSYLADPNALDTGNWSPLHIACYQRNETMLKMLLDVGKLNINIARSDGCTALHYASSAGLGSFVEILLEAGADPKLENNNGETPLHLACRSGTMDAINVLVKAGVDVNVKTRNGKSCVDLARSVGFKSAIDFLLSRT